MVFETCLLQHESRLCLEIFGSDSCLNIMATISVLKTKNRALWGAEVFGNGRQRLQLGINLIQSLPIAGTAKDRSDGYTNGNQNQDGDKDFHVRKASGLT